MRISHEHLLSSCISGMLDEGMLFDVVSRDCFWHLWQGQLATVHIKHKKLLSCACLSLQSDLLTVAPCMPWQLFCFQWRAIVTKAYSATLTDSTNDSRVSDIL